MAPNASAASTSHLRHGGDGTGPAASWGCCDVRMTCMKDLWKLNSANRYHLNCFPFTIRHGNVLWSGVNLLSFQFQTEIFALLQDKQVNQIRGKLVTMNLCNFPYIVGFCWKDHVDQNRTYFLTSIVFGSYIIIVFAGERGKRRSIGESQCGGQSAWRSESSLPTWSTFAAHSTALSLHFLLFRWR